MSTKKQMTQKEFKQALKDAGFQFENWGWEGILNMISCLYGRYAEEAKSSTMFDYYFDRQDKLFSILEERGFYKENK